MPQLTINGIALDAPENATVLEAASSLNIHIPTLCHAEGMRPNTSCMICVVEEMNQGRLLPACAAKTEAGMVVDTESEKVRHARRAVLELLLSEHLGDCEAPCERSCPARLNIPLMLRRLQRGETAAAQTLVRQSLVLPATLGRICTAPCEAGCRRGIYDDSIAICHLHGWLGEMASTDEQAPMPKPSGKNVAIIGAGPAGLAAAYVLSEHGHACRVYEKRPRFGGRLRDFSEEQLPGGLLDAEIGRLVRMGVSFVCDTEVGKAISLHRLHENYHAVVVACDLDVPKQDGVFRAAEKNMPVRSVASGKQAAHDVHAYLAGASNQPEPAYNSSMGRLPREQVAAYMVGRAPVEPDDEHAMRSKTGLMLFAENAAATREEAERCLHCDCHAPVSCKLREYATQYGARPKGFRDAERLMPNGLQRHGDVIFDAGKCVKCGLCVEITRQHKEALGLTFTDRGYTMQVSVPFGEPLDKALVQCAPECVKACPTGALAFESWEEREA